MTEIYLPPPQSTCAVSIVIPMYNAGKYIGALLESLLVQTFTDFEVIVVDDCSTDDSIKTVESYLPNFNGRLKLSRMKKNSGGPGAPTNKGIARTCGKYIWAVDNDDLVMNNAIEVLYNSAEKFNAEVVYMDSAFNYKDDPDNPVPDPKNFKLAIGPVVNPVFDPEDIGERLKLYCKRTSVVGWRRFVKRDFLIENEITFPEDVQASQDIIWTIELIFYAHRHLRIPEPLYIYRQRSDSVSHLKRSDSLGVEYWGELLVKNVESLCKFFNRQKFFRQNPQFGWMLIDWLERRYSSRFNGHFSSLPTYKIQKILEDLFVKGFGEHGEVISSLCTSVYCSRFREKKHLDKIKKLETRVAELEKQINDSEPKT